MSTVFTLVFQRMGKHSIFESASCIIFKLFIQLSVFVSIVALLKHKAIHTDGI